MPDDAPSTDGLPPGGGGGPSSPATAALLLTGGAPTHGGAPTFQQSAVPPPYPDSGGGSSTPTPATRPSLHGLLFPHGPISTAVPAALPVPKAAAAALSPSRRQRLLPPTRRRCPLPPTGRRRPLHSTAAAGNLSLLPCLPLLRRWDPSWRQRMVPRIHPDVPPSMVVLLSPIARACSSRRDSEIDTGAGPPEGGSRGGTAVGPLWWMDLAEQRLACLGPQLVTRTRRPDQRRRRAWSGEAC